MDFTPLFCAAVVSDTGGMSSTEPTTEELLVKTNLAIARILDGSQEYSLGEFRQRRADLAQLLAMKKSLERQLASQHAARLGAFNG